MVWVVVIKPGKVDILILWGAGLHPTKNVNEQDAENERHQPNWNNMFTIKLTSVSHHVAKICYLTGVESAATWFAGSGPLPKTR